MSEPEQTQQPRVVFDDIELGQIALDLEELDPQEVIAWGFRAFGDRAAIVSSFQIDGMAILDMAYRIRPDLLLITVDTGRLPPASYDFIEEVRRRYPEIRLRVQFPNRHEVESMVNRHGVNLFYQDVPRRLLCCHVRKVRPLLQALAGVDAWMTGLRRDQWASRANIRKAEIDHDHDGIVKINPLADWTEEEVLEYIRERDVPTHPLFARGYTSIGCDPCTRPIQPGEDHRAGRWWWEKNAPKECGMHCPIESGGFEHEVHAILGDAHERGDGI